MTEPTQKPNGPTPRSGYTVIRDTREKPNNGWFFEATASCEGTVYETLKTGDYTLRGYEDTFVIERKASAAEFVQNITSISSNGKPSRFKKELERLSTFTHPFIFLEFDMEEIINFPEGSGIPRCHWDRLRVTPEFFLRCVLTMQIKYKPQVILVGHHGHQVAASLFKRIIETCEPTSQIPRNVSRLKMRALKTC